MSVSNGQNADQNTFNEGFMSRKGDTDTVGKVALAEAGSGDALTNIQQLLNDMKESLGFSAEVDPNKDDYSSNNYILDGDSRKEAIEKLDAQIGVNAGDITTNAGDIITNANDILSIFDLTTPTLARKLINYANDAAYESAHGTPTGGECYFNTTDNEAKIHDGTNWVQFGGGSDIIAVQETPTGTIDGVNDTFTLSTTPTSDQSLKIFLDGIVQFQGSDYTVSGTTVTMTVPPAIGQSIYATYNEDISGGGVGEANTASNLGTGDGVFAQKVSTDLEFKSLKAGTGIILTPSPNEILIESPNSPPQTDCRYTGLVTGQTFTNAAISGPVRYNTLKFDDGSNYDSSTGIYTVPTDGRYHVVSSFYFAFQSYAGGSRFYLNIKLGGGVEHRSRLGIEPSAAVASTVYIQGETYVDALAGQQITIEVYFEGAATYNQASVANDENQLIIRRVN